MIGKLILFCMINNGFTITLLQLIPNTTNKGTSLEAYLISAIIALVGTISFLFIYAKQLNKLIKVMSDNHSKQLQTITEGHAKQLQDVYKDQIIGEREVINRNTQAFVQHTEASKEVAITNKENTEALHDLRLWLTETLGMRKRT